MSAAGSIEALRSALGQIHTEAAGVLDLLRVAAEDLPALLTDATAGNAEARLLINAVALSLAQVEEAPRLTPMLCVPWPQPLRNGQFASGVKIPRCSNPTQALGLAVCCACATDRAAVSRCAMEGLKSLWPDLRPLSVTRPSGGRA